MVMVLKKTRRVLMVLELFIILAVMVDIRTNTVDKIM